MATTTRHPRKVLITMCAGCCGLLVIAYPDWRTEARAQNYPLIGQLTISDPLSQRTLSGPVTDEPRTGNLIFHAVDMEENPPEVIDFVLPPDALATIVESATLPLELDELPVATEPAETFFAFDDGIPSILTEGTPIEEADFTPTIAARLERSPTSQGIAKGIVTDMDTLRTVNVTVHQAETTRWRFFWSSAFRCHRRTVW
jgi:hypothetical protein